MCFSSRRVGFASLILSAAGLARPAAAEHTLFEYQVSVAGAEVWSSSINANPGDSIDIRVRASYIGTQTPLGLGGAATMQPTLSNWVASDTLRPFAAVGGNQNGGVVPDAPGQYGRISPWGKVATTTASYLRGHTNLVSGTTYLRIAQAQVTGWFGTTGNTTGGAGVLIGQWANVGRTILDPPFNPNLQNLTLFKYSIILSPTATTPRDLSVFCPPEYTGERDGATGLRLVNWYASMDEPIGSIQVPLQATFGTIHVVPAPATLTLLGLVPLLRRRRP